MSRGLGDVYKRQNYIALEVEFGNRITIAPHEGELTEYNYVVNNIRHFIKERHGEADA